MLEAILGRLSHLGLVLRSSARGGEIGRSRPSNPGGTAWRLHSMLIDTMLDLAGLDYDAVARRLSLQPVLPGPWPQTGIKQTFPCGESRTCSSGRSAAGSTTSSSRPGSTIRSTSRSA